MYRFGGGSTNESPASERPSGEIGRSGLSFCVSASGEVVFGFSCEVKESSVWRSFAFVQGKNNRKKKNAAESREDAHTR